MWNRIYLLALLFWGITTSNIGLSQIVDEYLGDESVLYAQTKQVNQFFRRFNCEESPKGERYYPRDRQYRDPQQRKNYLPVLFDLNNPYLNEELKAKFIKEVTTPYDPEYLDFYGDEWFAEVKANFLFNGRRRDATLFLKLQKEPVGYKWVFTQVFFEPFKLMFQHADSVNGIPPFIHPLSHELDFMTLRKVFKDQQNVELYTSREYQPDHLTLFLYEIKKGNLKFETIKKVKFHFLQIENWYFELSEIQRSGPNKGWLISQLINIPEEQKNILLKYIYHE